MQIIAKRPFISSRLGIGNVAEGRILDTDDDYAGSLIQAGLAEAYTAGPDSRAPETSFFLTPGIESPESGPLLPVAPASQKPIVKKLKLGGKRTKKDAAS